jgi:periplasmic copper chaperone A
MVSEAFMRSFYPALLCAMLLGTASLAEAHVSITSGPAASSKTQKITFGVAHGCSGADTVKIRVEIPAGISGVRALTSDFGKPTVEKDGVNITAVTWQKPDADLQADDVQYYELTLRARVDAPAFSTVLFHVFQTCRTADGVETVVPWIDSPGGTGDPAPALIVAPAHIPGWNKFVIPAGAMVAAADLPVYLGDALIVWRGTTAYSSNANTMAMVAATPGVTALASDLHASDEIWAKY